MKFEMSPETASLNFMIKDEITNDEVWFYFKGSGIVYVYDGLLELDYGEKLIVHSIWNDEFNKHRAYELRTLNSIIYFYYDKIKHLAYVSAFCFLCALVLFIIRKRAGGYHFDYLASMHT